MKLLSNEELDIFINSLEKRKYHKDEFYNIFLDYLEQINYSYQEADEVTLEAQAFHYAFDLGFIGYNIIHTITDNNLLFNKINQYSNKTKTHIFHFYKEEEDEKNLSLGEIWSKWNNLPPEGWLASWCKCGEFFPITLDLGIMDVENNTLYDNINQFKVESIHIDNIQQADICDDGYIRFLLKDNRLFAAKPFKADNGAIYSFIDNPLDILK